MNLLYYLSWSASRFIFTTLFQRKAYHPERVPKSGPVIVAGNHASYFDPPLIGTGMSRDLFFLGRESLFRYRIVAWYLRQIQAVPVDRDGGGGAGLRAIMEQLRLGHGIVLFPEGTRTRDGKLQPARSGIGMIVIKSGAPVVPVRVFGTYEAFGYHAKYPKLNPLAVKYGHPMNFEALRAEAKSCSKDRLKRIYQEIADQIMAAIGNLEPHWDVSTFP